MAPFWGAVNLPEKASRDMGHRSDTIPISRDMGPLRQRLLSDKMLLQYRAEKFQLGLSDGGLGYLS